jgi:hypothetical protein
MDEDANDHFEDPPSRVEKQGGSEKHIAKTFVSKDNSPTKKTKNKKGPLFERISTTKTTRQATKQLQARKCKTHLLK